MQLIRCPACDAEVSAAAAACPKCGHPIAAKTYRGPPHECSQCGGKLKKTHEATSSGSGCVVLLIGLLLAPVLIGIPVIIYGIHLMGKTKALWQCKRCHATYPRIRRWYQLS